MHIARTSLLLGSLFLSACCFGSVEGGWDTTSCQLRPAANLEGNFHLDIQVSSVTLRSRSTRKTEEPELGLGLREVNKEFAEEKGLRPFGGLFVQSVERGGPAEGGGVVPGDLLLSVDGVEVLYLSTFEHHLRKRKPGDPCTLVLAPRGGSERREVKVQLASKVGSETDEDQVRLALAEGNAPPVFGFQFATLPADWTRRIYGDDKPAVLLGALELGSPGYQAGLRPGDRLVRAAGQPVDDANLFRERLQVWGRGRESIPFEVRSPRGETYVTDVALRDYQRDSSICVPLLFASKSNQRTSKVGIGPLHIITSYKSEYEASRSRDESSSGCYTVGWGLFNYRWSPSDWRVRVLWLISFGSD